ncbi:MAG: response regulator [Gemmatimonadetes bacterium]|nr:MAG: response regulator [Gemmatimonadota bacterium]
MVRRDAGGPGMNATRRRSGRPKILVIEDDAVARADLEARLAANGYIVARAADAASALTVVNRERPDLILLDLGLPGGDGFLVLERLRKIAALAVIPVLVITGRSDAETRKRVEALGVAPLLAKPVETEVLLAAIRAGLETKPD